MPEDMYEVIVERPRRGNEGDPSAFGEAWVYAKRKRQLSSAELKGHQLTNENAGYSRRFRLGTWQRCAWFRFASQEENAAA